MRRFGSRKSPAQTEEPAATSTDQRPPLWRVALWVASSACLSGIAIVVWNRSSLARMRDAEQGSAAEKESDREFV